MNLRPNPTDSLGLVKIPRARDCIGEECPIAARRGHCFTDWHHLYYPFGKFVTNGLLVKAFHDDRHNTVAMARCRHNSVLKTAQHTRYDFSLIPPLDVMVTFLDESAVLRDLGVTVKNMARIVKTLTAEDMRTKTNKPEQSMHWLLYFQDVFQDLRIKMEQFEVVPGAVVENVLYLQQANIDVVNAAGHTGLAGVKIDLLQAA